MKLSDTDGVILRLHSAMVVALDAQFRQCRGDPK